MLPLYKVKVDISPYWKTGGLKSDINLYGDAVVRDLLQIGHDYMSDRLQRKDEAGSGVYFSIEEARAGGSAPSQGTFRDTMVYEMTSFAHALIENPQMVYGAWLEGTSSRHYSDRFKGYWVFRQTKDHIEAHIAQVAALHRLRFES